MGEVADRIVQELAARLAEKDADPISDAVFSAAYQTLRKGAPGLSEATASHLSRSIAMKAKYAIVHFDMLTAKDAPTPETYGERG